LTADLQTLAVYSERIAHYDRLGLHPDAVPDMTAFLAHLPMGGRVLDLGCGPGHAAEAMAAQGFLVEAWDACPEMVALAAGRAGVTARLAEFDDLSGSKIFDGIWASFSLLHAPKRDFPDHIGRIARALVPGGLLYLGLKTGPGEGRDDLGRYYAYYDEAELIGHLEAAALRVEVLSRGKSRGLAGTVDPFITLLAHG
jgi:SAM-dependent methyltransferase